MRVALRLDCLRPNLVLTTLENYGMTDVACIVSGPCGNAAAVWPATLPASASPRLWLCGRPVVITTITPR